jgi:prolyl oligopeptidase
MTDCLIPALTYPRTRTENHVDVYHGMEIADPYRWLEDDMSAETGAWVAEQNAITQAYLGDIAFRDSLRQRLTALVNYERISAPDVKGQWQLFAKNDGLQNQPAFYLRNGEQGDATLLLDPNALSSDQTTRITDLTFNGDGTLIAYMVSEAGSDWQHIRVIDIATRTTLPDRIDWVKVSGVAWHRNGFFYSRYPAPGQTESAFSTRNDDHLVYYHVIGTPQADDVLVYADREHVQRFHHVHTTTDERFAVLYVSDRGQGRDGNAVLARDLLAATQPFQPVWSTFDDEITILDHNETSLIALTNRHAPNRRIVSIPLSAHDNDSAWTTLVAERAEPIDAATAAGDRLIVTYLKDVTSRVQLFHRDGTLACDVELPGLGTVTGFHGERDATHVYFTFTSFTAPPSVYRCDLATGATTCTFAPTVAFDPDEYVTTQVFVGSTHGAQVPAFIVSKKDVVLNHDNPTLMYGYGGFNISLPPAFSALRMAFLEQGGVFVQANLRGGNEYGEAWHQAGMKERKQTVFDDAVAVAEWLCTAGYTRPERLAIQGGSNGGLLVGAIMTQRPSLVRVALPAVGVLDMLRFHKFTIGWNWIAEYGSSDDADAFQYLLAYSPYHQLRDGVQYPATLITTGDHDDRVVPAHSFKFAARLQAAHSGDTPVLIRVETQSGHGSSSLSKSIAEATDVYAFLFHNLGMTPTFTPAVAATA